MELIEQMPPEERSRVSAENIRRTEEGYFQFLEAFNRNECYLCEKSLSSFSKKVPCIHWFLKPKGFKKHDLVPVANRYGVFQIQTYLRWVANQEGLAKHINDMQEEGTGTKLIELTIRYRNLEWSFSCAESDYLGHKTSQHAKHPHYHIQFRIDKRPFIKYSDLHLPLTEGDILSLEAKRHLPHIVKQKFPYGEGMSDVLNDNTVEVLINDSGGGSTSPEDAALIFDTLVMADEGTTIKGQDFYNLIQEAKAKGVTVASLMHKLPNVSARVFVTPGPGVVEQAPRKGRVRLERE
jgi:hypothetical protein